MGTTRCKIPIGSFYGHIAVLPGESFYEPHSLGEIPRDCLPVRFIYFYTYILIIY